MFDLPISVTFFFLITPLVIFLFLFVISRLTSGKTKSSTCLVGKTALVTGGNEGIGYQVCLNLASRGCRVIIADLIACQKVCDKIIKFTNNNNITAKNVDLASFSSVRKLAQDLNSCEDKLDILIHNAVIVGYDEPLTEDGFNPILQVNYFSPFLLTHLVLNLLKKGGASRVIFSGSVAAYTSTLKDAKSLICTREKSIFGSLHLYGDSKLAHVFACEIFTEKLFGKCGITFNALHTGVVRTRIFKKFKRFHPNDWVFSNIGTFVSNYLGKDLWEGSQTATHLAVSNSLKSVSGKFFLDCKEMPKPFQAGNKKLGEEIWKISEEIVGLKPQEKI